METTKVLIIEDEIVIGTDLKLLLERNGYEVTDIAISYSQALASYKRMRPDIILSDIYLDKSKSGIETVLHLNEKNGYCIPVIIISAYSEPKTIEQSMKINPLFYITKPFTPKQIIAALQMAEQKVLQFAPCYPTHRECDILKLLAKGNSSKLIAQALNISYHTVESHRKNLFTRFEVRSTAELIYLATHEGWI